MKKLSQLLRESGIAAVSLRGDADVARITDDSRKVVPGGCFIAAPGPLADGHDYIDKAVAAGAASIVCQDAGRAPDGPAVAVVADARAAIGPLAQCFYDFPARRLKLIGITGTKGKTTVSYICREILRRAGMPCGLIGTIECDSLARRRESHNTTPGAVDLAAMMAEMVEAGGRAAVMEVSSHALSQHRTAGLDFAAAVFTNLHSEHMDYHATMENYFQAKSRLFTGLAASSTAVINGDDPWALRLAEMTPASVTSFALDGPADIAAANIRVGGDGSRFTLKAGDVSRPVHCSLIGRHNVYNCLAAAGACAGLGVEMDAIADALNGALSVPGRLQTVTARQDGIGVYVDYAHTDDSLLNVLTALRPLCRGRLIVLFGCGGDRDRTKRPRMARVAERNADVLVITNDNPRTEDPQRILDEIVAGLDDYPSESVHVLSDRREAIEFSIRLAEPGDMVLLAGKGHETYQIMGETTIHFDDAEVAANVLRTLAGCREGEQA